MRVLQVFSSLDMGGAESRMMDVFRNINHQECEFTFLSMSLEEQYYENEIISKGGKIIKIPSPRISGALQNLFKICRIIKEGKYDVVHAHTSFHCGIVMLAGWLAGTPVRISHARTTGSQNSTLKNKIGLFLGRLMISAFSTERLAISSEAGRYLFGAKKFLLMPNAIDCDKYFQVSDEVLDNIKRIYNIPDNSISLGLVGRFDPMKNQAFAVSVLEEYRKIHDNAYLILIGDGAQRKDIQAVVDAHGLTNYVIFTGIQSNVNEWMHIFDAVLVPSSYEGLGGVILEAQAAGVQVLKSDTFTDAADLEVGLVHRLSISNGCTDWVNKIDEVRLHEKIDVETLRKAFSRSGYSLSSEILSLQRIYKGEKI